MNISQSIYKNRYLHKGLEFASDKSPLFIAGTTLALSTVVRPVSILATPNTDKENKKLACMKSVISAGLNFAVTLGLSLPLIYGIKRLEKTPSKYLSQKSIENLKDSSKELSTSKTYEFGSQLFKLGLGAIIAAPKSIINARLLSKFNNRHYEEQKVYSVPSPGERARVRVNSSRNYKEQSHKTHTSFTGTEGIAKLVGRVLDNKGVQEFAKRHKDSNFPMHIAALTDTVATGTFIYENNKSKNISQNKRNVLNKNCAISTGLSIGAGYIIDKALDKPTERFINGFKKANKYLPNLEKCINGIKIAKPTLIMGGIYYIAIPILSTFFAERLPHTNNRKIS